jgi:hypothetical protein
LSAFELFSSYRKGWVDAAASRAKDSRFVEHETRRDLSDEYLRGYDDGRRDLGRAMAPAMKRLKYTPNHFRGGA